MAKLVDKKIDVPFLLYYVSAGAGSTCPFLSLHLKQMTQASSHYYNFTLDLTQ